MVNTMVKTMSAHGPASCSAPTPFKRWGQSTAYAKLVKAFNQLPAKVLASPPPDDRGRRVIFISSDHSDASTEVAALAGRLGFAPLELGKIAEGGRLIQARGPLVLQNLVKYEQ
jgi:predicted dinucleotide-binding enzyme